MMERRTRPANAPIAAGRQPRTKVTASTIVSASTASTSELKNAVVTAGAAVVQEPCGRSLPQLWVFHRLSVGHPLYRIENLLSHQCLDALGGATNGTQVVQWPCASISNQTWDTGVTLTGGDTAVTVKSRVSGTTSHCLDVPGGELFTSGLPMQIWGCNGTDAQTWILEEGF